MLQRPGDGVKFDLQSLIQELLLALVGITGDVFVDDQDPRQTEVATPEVCTISLAPCIALADDVNRDELNQLVQMGFHFKAVKHFIQQEQQQVDSHKSMYRCALCCSLDEVLCLFEDEVVLLQDSLLLQDEGDDEEGNEGRGLSRGLPGITYQLADFQRLLTHLHYMVYELRRRSSHTLPPSPQDSSLADGSSSSSGDAGGGLLVLLPHTCGARLLQWLHDRRAHGEPLLQTCTQRLMWHVHQVLFNQLTMWMVHGLLINNGTEFFINTNPDAGKSKQQTEEGGGPQAPPPAACPDTDAVRDNSSSNSSSSKATSSLSPQCLDTAFMSEADTYSDFHSAFVVNNLQRPPGMTTHTAASIEFVGRAVRLLKSAPAAAKLREMQDSCSSYSQQQQQQQQGLLPPGSCVMPQPLLPYGDAMAYAAALRMLQQQDEYSPAALDRTVEAIRADVASRLWQLVVVESRLLDHLTAVKDYLLLGKGDLYQSLLTDAAALLAKAPETVTDKDLAVPWQSAASKSTAALDPHFKYFSLTVDSSLAVGQIEKMALRLDVVKQKANTGTAAAQQQLKATELVARDVPHVADCLKVEARLPWPLGVLITREHLDSYNLVFALLLKVKRVQLHLETAWQELGRLCGRKGGKANASDIGELLQLRQHMGHLISNLQVYLQLDVVEANFDELVQQVEAAQDYAQVAHAHTSFVNMIKTQSLLLSHKLQEHLHDVCSLSRQLCVLVKGAQENGIDLGAVQEVKSAFDLAIKDLSWAMRSKFLQQQDKAPYLNQLHERLDYNGYLRKCSNVLELRSSSVVQQQQHDRSMAPSSSRQQRSRPAGVVGPV